MVEPLSVAGRKVWIGCSGYVYKHWRGAFYPQDLPASRWLQYYVNEKYVKVPQVADVPVQKNDA